MTVSLTTSPLVVLLAVLVVCISARLMGIIEVVFEFLALADVSEWAGGGVESL